MAQHYDKAGWARRKAASLREQARELRDQRIPSADWRKVRAKMRALSTIERDAQRLDNIARNAGG